jgi:riboflavin synthase
MFTGLVVERGRLTGPPQPSSEGGVRLRLGYGPAIAERMGVGASLAVSGVCLTVVETAERGCAVELSPETLSRTRLGALRAGDEVNLEPALRAGDALGGHWVQGHVDGLLRVVGRRDEGEHRTLAFELPAELRPFLVEKGSVALDGVSLTVAHAALESFDVALIPHTLQVTTLGALQIGDPVHYEIDVLAKYVHQALAAAGRLGA